MTEKIVSSTAMLFSVVKNIRKRKNDTSYTLFRTNDRNVLSEKTKPDVKLNKRMEDFIPVSRLVVIKHPNKLNSKRAS